MPSPGMVTDMGTDTEDTAMGTATATATDTTDEVALEVHVFQSDQSSVQMKWDLRVLVI